MDPQEYMPTTKMPNLRLEPQQAKDLTAYLLENRNIESRDHTENILLKNSKILKIKKDKNKTLI